MKTLNQQFDLLRTLFQSHTRLQYKKGETIIRPEDDPRGVFLIEWGFVKACTTTKYGEENLLITRGSGSIFPLIWVFTGIHRNVTYEAMEDVSVWRVSREAFQEFLEKNPEINALILDFTIESYRLHSERVMTLSYRTARERILSFLLTTANRYGIEQDGVTVIHAPYKQSDIASSVNTTRETTSRELNTLRKKGIVKMVDGYLAIRDKEEIRELLAIPEGK